MTKPSWLSQLWHLPGTVWRALLAAAPWRHWVQAIGAMTFTLAMLAVVLIAWRGGWPAGTEEQRLTILGHANIIFGLLTGLNVLALTDLAINLRASKTGIDLSAAADDHQGPKPLAEITTTTTVTAPVATEAPDDTPPWERKP